MPTVQRKDRPRPTRRGGVEETPPGGGPRVAKVLGALVVLVTLACFAPVFTADFTNWDDQATVAQNPRLNPPGVANWLSFWDPRRPYMDLYVPVTYTVWSALAAVSYVPQPDEHGVHLNPWVFHSANVLLHALAALAA